MLLVPLGSNVVIRIEKKRQAGGIFIPDTAREKTGEGVIVALGPTCSSLVLHVGDRVVFDRFEGREVEVGKTDFVILPEEKVLGILRETPSSDTASASASAPAPAA